MRAKEIDMTQLTHGELMGILKTYDEAMDIITTSNNTLLAKLHACPGTTNDHVEILNNWSLFHAHVMDRLGVEFMRAGQTVQ